MKNPSDVSSNLHASEPFRRLIENAQDIITVVAHDGTMRYTSPAAERVMGFKPEELIGENAFAYIHEDDHDAVFQAMVEVMAAPGAVRQVAYRFRHKDGSWRLLESIGSAMMQDDGTLEIIVNSRDITERHRAEASLRASEALNRALLDAIPDAMLRLSREGTYVGYKAPSQFEWFVDPADLLGKRTEEVLPHDLAQEVTAACQRAIETGQMQTLDYGVDIKGKVRFREARCLAFGEGEVLIIVRDFTNWKQAEMRLRESEARFRDLFEHSPDAIFVEDFKGEVLDVNPAACRLHRCDREVLIGKNMLDLVPPDQREQAQATFDQMKAGKLDYVESVSRTGEGQMIPVEIRARRMLFGTTPALLLHVRDLTERRQAEEALRKSEAQNRAIVDALPDALVRLDRHGTYLEVRLPRDYEAFTDPQALIGLCSYDLLPPEIARTARACVDRALETGTMQTFEYEIEVHGEKHVREGRVVQCGEDEVISIQRDITDLKQREEALRRSRQQLRDLAQRQQTVREAERTRIAREVHDQLGQALTALRMDVSWIEKGLLDEQDSLHQHVDTMKALIDDTIQTVRRIASELRPGILDDLGLAAALEWQTQEFARRTGLRFSFTHEGHLDHLDRNRSTATFRVFQEILTNIARHADASRIEVTLRGAADALTLIVKDNGRGINDLDAVNSNSLGMLGMRERTQAWDGTIAFHSAPGEGTEVTVRIPIPEMTEA